MTEPLRKNFVEWLRAQGSRAASSLPEAYEVPEALRAGELFAAFQPLVDLPTGKTFAYEALLRSTAAGFTNPIPLFDSAIRAGCCGALGRLARELAVESCRAWPLFLNVHPHEFAEGWLVRPDDPVFMHDLGVFLEITESVPLSHFHHCHHVLKEVRSKGVALAVDDLGAGYSNLRYIADLSPEIVKLDRSLVAELDRDPRRQKLVKALVKLCEELGARVVAEGIERVEEAKVARDVGAHIGQGYFFARPATPPPRVSDEALGQLRAV